MRTTRWIAGVAALGALTLAVVFASRSGVRDAGATVTHTPDIATAGPLQGGARRGTRIDPVKFATTFSRYNAPIARIRPGDTILTKTVDAHGFDEHNKSITNSGNPLTGPFFVVGAEPGDAVAIHFIRIAMNRPTGFTNYRLDLVSLVPDAIEGVYPSNYKAGAVRHGRSDLVLWNIDLAKQTVKLRDPVSRVTGLEFPARPMLGCVGVAASGDDAPSTGVSGKYGGNMDFNDITSGSIVILPVHHSGALVYIGDGHALQGDGEALGTGIETSMDVEFSVSVLKGGDVHSPRVVTNDHIISIGSQPEFVSSMNRAVQLATTDMIRWLGEDYHLEPWAAHMLIGTQATYSVVTIAGSVALKIPRKYLPRAR